MIHIDRLDKDQRPGAPHLQIDINQAGWPEITLLPGISETLARRVVEFREQHGRFQSLDDLQQVPGIGPISLGRIQPFLAPLTARTGADASAEVAAKPAS